MNWAYGVMKRLTEENLIKLEAACERSAAQFLSRLEPYLADLVPGADDIVFTEVNWDDLTLDFLGEERDDAGL